LEHLKGLTKLRTLKLGNTRFPLRGVNPLQETFIAVALRFFHGRGTRVTDAGLQHLKGLTQLQTLDLSGTRVTGSGLEHLKGLAQLHTLFLSRTQVTDARLVRLKGLTQVKSLFLDDTQVTDQGVKRLQETLPSCTIHK